MGRVLGKIFKIVAIVASIAIPFLNIPVWAAVLAGIGAAGIGLLGSKLDKPRLDGSASFNVLKTTQGGDARKICYGQAATGGTIVYQENHNNGGSWKTDEGLSLVVAVAGHEIDSFVSFYWKNDAITFSANNAVGNLNNFMYKYDHLGTDGQAVDSNLDSISSIWNSTATLSGIAYSHIKLRASNEKFPNGLEEMKFVVKGRKLYDPRKDSTNGGSGAHRLTNQSTWEWSSNPVLALVDYMRGIRVNNSSTTVYDGKIIAGMAISDSKFDWPNIISEADICDQNVTLKAGGSEKRYSINGFIDPRRQHRETLRDILSCMGGSLVFQGGKWRVYAAAPRTAVKSRDSSHIVGAVSMAAKRPISDRINSVRGQFIDAADKYAIKDIPPLKNATYISKDGGQELWADFDLPLTTSVTTAQRLHKIILERSRREKRIELTMMPIAVQDQAMDAISFTYEPLGLSAAKFLIADWNLKFVKDEKNRQGFLINCVYLEEDDNIFGWTASSEEQTPETVTETNTGNANNGQLTQPPLGSTFVVNSNPLTATDAGATATISVAAFTAHAGTNMSISYSSGSITGLNFNTTYYVYADDPNFLGGAVTYVATTNKTVIGDSDGRIYVGYITTPSDGGGGTGGGPAGGIGGGKLY